jgi:lysophospholipase L1-like esterase
MLYKRHFEGDFVKAQSQHSDWPVVISEGDSWFSYADVIGRLDDPGFKGPQNQRSWALLRLEKAGDEILTILSGAQRSNLRGFFRRWKLDALLFSGGGNDIIGPDLLPLLRPYKDGMEAADLVAKARYERRLRQIQDSYRELLDLLVDAEQKTKVFVHSYDYVVPSDRPVKLLGIIKVSGPWMLPYFKERKIPPKLHAEVVKLLIDGFVATIDAVAAEPRGGVKLIRIETRGLIDGAWKDEIHPSNKGARKVATAFEIALRSEGILK